MWVLVHFGTQNVGLHDGCNGELPSLVLKTPVVWVWVFVHLGTQNVGLHDDATESLPAWYSLHGYGCGLWVQCVGFETNGSDA